jgi:zinc transport system substrate-binding protein
LVGIYKNNNGKEAICCKEPVKFVSFDIMQMICNNKVMKKLIFPLILTILLVLGAYYISTSRSPQVDNDRPSAIVTIYPLQEWAKTIGGDLVTVENITPAGAEPHDFEPSPKNIAKISNADVFIYNNIGLEPWAIQIIPQLNTLAVDASKDIELLENNFHDHEDESRIDEGQQYDPHVWIDPFRAKQQAANIAQAFIKVDPENKDTYNANLESLSKELDKLDREFSILNTCSNKAFISSHAAFQYLSEKYNLDMITITGISSEEEPSPQKIAEVSRIARELNIKYILFETLGENKYAETIVREIQGEALVLNHLEGLTSKELANGKNYFTVQRDNLNNLLKALQCNQ